MLVMNNHIVTENIFFFLYKKKIRQIIRFFTLTIKLIFW